MTGEASGPALAEAFAAHLRRANAAFGEGRPADALAEYDAALVIAPAHPAAVGNRAAALRALGRLEEARAGFAHLEQIAPNHPEPHARLGDMALEAGQPAEALSRYQRALALDPTLIHVWASVGLALQALDRPEKAVVAYDRALARDPAFLPALANRGVACRELNRLAESAASLQTALAIAPDDPILRANLGVTQLLAGDLPEGFRNHEHRWRIEGGIPEVRRIDQPPWLGEGDIAGKTLLIHSEQGLGDSIQFCRYARRARARGARVVMEVPATLKPLFASLEGVDVLIARGEPLPDFDLHCPMMSLPLAFGTTLATIPHDDAYLTPPADRLARWRSEVGAAPGLKVGVVWSGKPTHNNDRNRSLPATDLLAAMPETAAVFCLHDRVRPEDEAALAARPDLRRFDGRLADFADTAALASMMDVVVSVDTSSAHLAAALGRPTFILIPFAPDWRWLLGRDDSPWYPSVRLFRQPAIGDWATPLAAVKTALEAL